jgi:hypothetical protein
LEAIGTHCGHFDAGELASLTAVVYERIESAIEMERCVLLDGAMGTELPLVGQPGAELDERLWGTRALIDSPEAVLNVHRGYVAARCDVISTNTWGLAAALGGSDRSGRRRRRVTGDAQVVSAAGATRPNRPNRPRGCALAAPSTRPLGWVRQRSKGRGRR